MNKQDQKIEDDALEALALLVSNVKQVAQNGFAQRGTPSTVSEAQLQTITALTGVVAVLRGQGVRLDK